MNTTAERLSRISALRPRAAPPEARPVPGGVRDPQPLLSLLGGEIRTNRLGCHVRVTRAFARPVAQPGSVSALKLACPQLDESAADPSRWLFLDTETTGLAGGTGTYAFLVGVAWWEADHFVVEQYFMRDHAEEPSLLLGLLERLHPPRVLVTYNGKSFDWPLLHTRYQMTRTGRMPEPAAHLDLLHPARQLWRLRLDSVPLSRLEREILNLNRGGDIASETIPRKYFEFIRGGPPEPIRDIFRHNRMDLRGLAALALHMARLLEDPERNSCCAEELLGISRMLQRRGAERPAARICQMALERGLPPHAKGMARRELAIMAQRRRDFERAGELWAELLDDPAEWIRAHEQLAIHYERHARQPERAAGLCREALMRLQEGFRGGRLPLSKYMRWHEAFQHRLARLGSGSRSGARSGSPVI